MRNFFKKKTFKTGNDLVYCLSKTINTKFLNNKIIFTAFIAFLPDFREVILFSTLCTLKC